MEKTIEEIKSSGESGEKKTKFRTKKGMSKTYVGFFSMTKKFQAQIDRIVSAIQENTQVNLARNQIEQQKIIALKQLAESLKLIQIQR